MTIQAALNGNRMGSPVPKATTSIIESAISCIRKGAGSIHFHTRDANGNESLEGKYVDEQVGQLRTIVKGIPIGISTGEWIEPDLTKRLDLIRGWKNLPDFVSINYDEPGFEQMTELISKMGIHIEAGLSSPESAKNFSALIHNGNYIRILIEPREQKLEVAIATIQHIESHLAECDIELPYLLHGVDTTCWDLFRMAIRKGYQTRMGLEDTLTLPNGDKARSNMELIEHARQIKAGYPEK